MTKLLPPDYIGSLSLSDRVQLKPYGLLNATYWRAGSKNQLHVNINVAQQISCNTKATDGNKAREDEFDAHMPYLPNKDVYEIPLHAGDVISGDYSEANGPKFSILYLGNVGIWSGAFSIDLVQTVVDFHIKGREQQIFDAMWGLWDAEGPTEGYKRHYWHFNNDGMVLSAYGYSMSGSESGT